jgi:hypothetical protein
MSNETPPYTVNSTALLGCPACPVEAKVEKTASDACGPLTSAVPFG